MKRKLTALLLALLICLTAGNMMTQAAGFSDITDTKTANAAEILRLMGVIDGYEDGTFHPDTILTRAQFCKMTVHFIGADNELDRYAAYTVFPDVKPSYWAAGYINLAARGRKIIAGYADGMFHPENPVTIGHAVTILLRLLGYKDEDMGGIWPDGFVAQARSIKLLEDIPGDGNTDLSRAQAALLFRNLLKTDTAEGKAWFTLSAETTLTSLDGGAGTMVTSDETYDMDKPKDSTFFVNMRGKVVLRGDTALTFLPTDTVNTSAPSTGAVIVAENNSTTGFSALTGGRTDYVIYKNGLPASTADLRKGDVATYSAVSNAVLICDTRVSAYYESCYPAPASPLTVEILGGTVFNVLPSAADSVGRYKPGKVVTFLLSADGQIAGADSNTVGNAVVLTGGSTRLLCGTTEIPMKTAASGVTAGQPAYVASDEKGVVYFTPLRNSVNADLNLTAGTMGSRKLAPNIRYFDDEGAVSMDQIERDVIPSGEISGVHLNWAGDVDMVVFGSNTVSATWYGRAVTDKNVYAASRENTVTEDDEESPSVTPGAVSPTPVIDTSGGAYRRMLTLVYGEGKTLGPVLNPIRDVENGEYIAIQLNRAGDRVTSIRNMQKLEKVSFASWIGKTAVTYGGKTYTVSENVPCWNLDNNRWMTLENARLYAQRATLYVADGAVRIVEIGS